MIENPLLKRLPATPDRPGAELLDLFLDYAAEKKLELYPAQEEAILELFDDHNVILNTPTGSGKSLVATALHFKSMAQGHRSVYTCPIKALVNEKFLALCRDFGPDNVGLATGDATVNRDAPILCCTAEILANHALSQGGEAPFRDVIMDEFHYYSDASRGVAWQIPLLTMNKSRFLLMSATLGSTAFFAKEMTRLTGAESTVVSSTVRPVPLEFRYVDDQSLDGLVQELVEARQTPVYLVHFTQNDVAETAQTLLCVNYCTAAEKAAIAEAIVDVPFNSPYGKEVKRCLRHGIGLHHAGLLPRYRVLMEQLAQRGLLKIICGTDTLGVGINVPIRTVVLTRLTKFGGVKTGTLSARDFHQIAGRAGRKGFDDVGFVIAMAPDHVIENTKQESKASGDPKKMKKLVKRKPPEGFVGWNEETFKKLQSAAPEALGSKFQVTHGMLLQVLGQPGDGCRAMQQLIADSHETTAAKKQHRKRAWQLFRSLVERKIIQIIPRQYRGDGPKLRLGIDLQEDFSLNHALSLWLIDTLALLDPAGALYPLEVMSLVEAIVENPEIILRRQLDKLKTEKMGELKAAGVEYDERIAELEKLEYPKPGRDFIYDTFNAFAAAHPWVGQDNIKPKSIVREMYEDYESFSGYVHRYELQRQEGVLLRHISSIYKVLAQTVPPVFKTEAVQEMEDWLAGVLRGTDSSLLDEWERLKDPNYRPASEAEDGVAGAVEKADITRNRREFTALIRAAVFQFLRFMAEGRYESALAVLTPPDALPGAKISWTGDALVELMDGYYAGHERLTLDPEARNSRHTYIKVSEDGMFWKIDQVMVDPEALNDWQVSFRVDLAAARAAGRPVLVLNGMGPVAGGEGEN
ncbi:MAG: box helicase domain protein [Verrucomicrobiales bacterium]|nr:box helicase domain protein [Verrucomicrobiales bacterium]